MSFYRIYRPQIISEIDNISVREQLLSLLSKNKKDLPHAYLFEGPKGSGKTTAARIIAKLFNCRKPTGKGPCGKCPSCLSIATGSNIDVLEIDAASNRGIDDVRELRDKINLSPASDPYKVYIIDEVHMMTTEAFNALLKTLEEPPPHAVFILATTDPQKVPATVRSRCMEIRFGKAKKEELLSALSRIAKKENIDIQKDALEAIAIGADGAFRDAVKVLEQASFIKGPITSLTIVSQMLGSEDVKREAFLTMVLAKKNIQDAFACLREFSKQGVDMKTLLRDCLVDLQNDMIGKITGTEIQRVLPWNKEDVKELTKQFMKAYQDIRTTPIPELPIELAIVDFIERDLPAGRQGLAQDEAIKTDEREIGKHLPGRQAGVMKARDERKTGDERKIKERDELMTDVDSSDHVNLEKLTAHWSDFIEALKPLNHSVAGVVRGSRPKSVENGVVTIEAFYTFHQERLSDARVRDILAAVLKKLFGVKVRVEIVLGKK